MMIDLKSGSRGSNILVGCMACVTLGSIALFSVRHVWLRCVGEGEEGADVAPDGAQRREEQRQRQVASVPAGAALCDRLLFGAESYGGRAGARGRAGRDLSLLI